MAGQLKRDRVFANFKQPKGYKHVKTTNAKTYRDRPGMSDAHLGRIRELPCCVCYSQVRSEAHHLKQGTGERGLGLRSTDKYTVPLCPSHHYEVEHIGSKNEQVWFTSRGLDALALALALWGSGDVNQMLLILEAHRS